MDDEDYETMSPDVRALLDNKDLKHIFVSGKGGVGKSSCSSALSTLLAQHRSTVLLVSLDPAHNLSDVFEQQFGPEAQKVTGYDNLYALELDMSSTEFDYSKELLGELENIPQLGGDLLSSLPGFDEALSLFKLMKHIDTLDYDVIVFDMAPSGQALKLLSMAQTLNGLFDKVNSIRGSLGGLLESVTSMIGAASGGAGGDNAQGMSAIFSKLDEMQAQLQEIDRKLQDPTLTQIVTVCIPEFLSLFETEKLVQALLNLGIDCQHIIVNQILYPSTDGCSNCNMCKSRSKMQSKYLEQLDLLYADDFHLVKLPLLLNEVRGVDSLNKFAKMLLDGPDPYALPPPSD